MKVVRPLPAAFWVWSWYGLCPPPPNVVAAVTAAAVTAAVSAADAAAPATAAVPAVRLPDGAEPERSPAAVASQPRRRQPLVLLPIQWRLLRMRGRNGPGHVGQRDWLPPLPVRPRDHRSVHHVADLGVVSGVASLATQRAASATQAAIAAAFAAAAPAAATAATRAALAALSSFAALAASVTALASPVSWEPAAAAGPAAHSASVPSPTLGSPATSTIPAAVPSAPAQRPAVAAHSALSAAVSSSAAVNPAAAVGPLASVCPAAVLCRQRVTDVGARPVPSAMVLLLRQSARRVQQRLRPLFQWRHLRALPA